MARRRSPDGAEAVAKGGGRPPLYTVTAPTPPPAPTPAAAAAPAPLPPLARDAARTLWSVPLPPATPTGFADVDKALGGGLRAESIYLLTSGTGRGKTGLAAQVGRHICGELQRSLVWICTELSPRQTLARFAAQVLNQSWLSLYDLGPSETDTIVAALDGLKLRVAKPPRDRSVVDMLKAVADHEGQSPILVLDYLQYLARSGNPDDRRLANAAASDQIGRWAEDEHSSGLLISAVGRSWYGNDKAVGARDFEGAAKESGDLEYDASALLHLECDPCPPDGTAPAKLHISKSRFGAGGGTVGLRFFGAVGVFEPDESASLTPKQLEVIEAVRGGATTNETVGKAIGTRKGEAGRLINALVHAGILDRCPLRVVRTPWEP